MHLPVVYKGIKLDCGYRVDMVVMGAVLVEVKAIEHIAPVHEAQLLTYLRMGGWKAGLLKAALLYHGLAFPSSRHLRSYVSDCKLKKNQIPASSRLAAFW